MASSETTIIAASSADEEDDGPASSAAAIVNDKLETAYQELREFVGDFLAVPLEHFGVVEAPRSGRHELGPHGLHPPNCFVYKCSLAAALNSVSLGYEIGVMSGAMLFVTENFNLSNIPSKSSHI